MRGDPVGAPLLVQKGVIEEAPDQLVLAMRDREPADPPVRPPHVAERHRGSSAAHGGLY